MKRSGWGIFLVFLLIVSMGQSKDPGASVDSGQQEWQKWIDQLKASFQKPLSAPSAVQFTYLEKESQKKYLRLSSRIQFVDQCLDCLHSVEKSGDQVIFKHDDQTQKLADGQSVALASHAHIHLLVKAFPDGRIRIFVYDLSQKNLSQKRVRDFFAYSPKGKYPGRLTYLKTKRAVKMGRSDGSVKDMYAVAEIVFDSQAGALTVYDFGMSEDEFSQQKEVMLLFRDLSNGTKTYGAGRFVNLEFPKPMGQMKEGAKVVVDFNFAYNPACAVSGGYHCPLPQDLLEHSLEFGERYLLKAKH